MPKYTHAGIWEHETCSKCGTTDRCCEITTRRDDDPWTETGRSWWCIDCIDEHFGEPSRMHGEPKKYRWDAMTSVSWAQPRGWASTIQNWLRCTARHWCGRVRT